MGSNQSRLFVVTATAAAGVAAVIAYRSLAKPACDHKAEADENNIEISATACIEEQPITPACVETKPIGNVDEYVTIDTLDKLHEVTGSIVTLQSIAHVPTAVCVSDTRLGHVPPLLMQLTRLTKLNLSGCSLVHLPWNVTELRNLQELSVGRNQLTSLPLEIGALTGLTQLDASHNALRTVPDQIGACTGLRGLNLMCNQLTSLPDSIGELTGLVILGLKSNRLAQLPASFSRLCSLVELFITDNQLTTLPEGFGALTSLVKLQASFNRLNHLPPSVLQLPKLELMRIAVCDVPQLPALLQGQMAAAQSAPDAGTGDAAVAWPRLAWFSLGGNPACAEMPKPRPSLVALPSIADLTIGSKLGDGASGEVMQATYEGRQVALKLFRSDVSPDGRTDEEVAISCSVDHPHLTRVIAQVASPKALLMEVVTGTPMAAKPTSQHLLRCKWSPATRFTLPQALAVLLGVASALQYLHKRGICHGDVYAHNILVDEATWHATLCDFGASFCYNPATEPFWQAMEVRAFGLFMKDIADRIISTTGGAGGAPAALAELVAACTELPPAQRPTFQGVLAALQRVPWRSVPLDC